MKVCILSIVNIKHMSLISLYTSFLEEKGIDYDIIYVDKYEEVEKINAREIYRYNLRIDRNWSRVRKLFAYIKFKKYAQKILKQNDYDYVIVWRTETALLFVNYLTRYLKQKYLINIRDYCMEKNPLVLTLLKKIIRNSLFTTVSSEGFKKFLPFHNYITVHSFNERVLSECKEKNSLRVKGEPIRICFIGYVRFFENDKKLIEALGNDSRYIIQFFGEGSHNLEKFSKEKGIKNVEFVYGFKVEDTSELLQRADVINNLYGNNEIALDTAISIKYYYSLYLNLPILVYKGTFMDEITRKTGTGFSVGDNLDNLADDFYEWYHSISFSRLRRNCSEQIREIKLDNKNFYSLLESRFIKKNI